MLESTLVAGSITLSRKPDLRGGLIHLTFQLRALDPVGTRGAAGAGGAGPLRWWPALSAPTVPNLGARLGAPRHCQARAPRGVPTREPGSARLLEIPGTSPRHRPTEKRLRHWGRRPGRRTRHGPQRVDGPGLAQRGPSEATQGGPPGHGHHGHRVDTAVHAHRVPPKYGDRDLRAINGAREGFHSIEQREPSLHHGADTCARSATFPSLSRPWGATDPRTSGREVAATKQLWTHCPRPRC